MSRISLRDKFNKRIVAALWGEIFTLYIWKNAKNEWHYRSLKKPEVEHTRIRVQVKDVNFNIESHNFPDSMNIILLCRNINEEGLREYEIDYVDILNLI